MVGTTTGHMHATSAHAFNDGVKRNIDFQNDVEFDTGLFHGVSLRDGARKTVKQKTFGAVGLGNAFFDQADDDVVTHQTTRVHHFFGGQAHSCSRFDSGTQHIAGRYLGDAVMLANKGGLCAFSSAWRAQQNQSHCLPCFIFGTVLAERFLTFAENTMQSFRLTVSSPESAALGHGLSRLGYLHRQHWVFGKCEQQFDTHATKPAIAPRLRLAPLGLD